MSTQGLKSRRPGLLPDKQLGKDKARKVLTNERTFIRTMDRFGLCEYYSSLGLFLDGDFFDVWKGSLVVVEYKRLLELDGILNIYYDIQSTKGEVIVRTDFSKKILHPDEVEGV